MLLAPQRITHVARIDPTSEDWISNDRVVVSNRAYRGTAGDSGAGRILQGHRERLVGLRDSVSMDVDMHQLRRNTRRKRDRA